MQRLIAIAMVLAACDKADRGSDVSGASIILPSDDSGSGESDSGSSDESSSGGNAVAGGPYGQCESDPTCHCERHTCVKPCSVDTDCPGSGAVCIANGCFIECTAASSGGEPTNGWQAKCDIAAESMISDTADFRCMPAASIEDNRWVCSWTPID